MRNRRFLLWGFKPPRDLVRSGLGSLEQQALDVIWQTGRVTVRDVHAAVGGGTAYTTVMTTLDRLFRKGLLEREKSGRAYLYSARVTREELQEFITNDVIAGLLAGHAPAPLPFLSNLVDVVGERDRTLLDELERLVRLKRKQLHGRDDT